MSSERRPEPTHDLAELSSIASVLEDMQDRVVAVADSWREIERDDIAGDLYDVERSLRSARRRVQRAMQGMNR